MYPEAPLHARPSEFIKITVLRAIYTRVATSSFESSGEGALLVSPLLSNVGSPLALPFRRYQATMNTWLLSRTPGSGKGRRRIAVQREKRRRSRGGATTWKVESLSCGRYGRVRALPRSKRFAFLVGTTLPLSIYHLFTTHFRASGRTGWQHDEELGRAAPGARSVAQLAGDKDMYFEYPAARLTLILTRYAARRLAVAA